MSLDIRDDLVVYHLVEMQPARDVTIRDTRVAACGERKLVAWTSAAGMVTCRRCMGTAKYRQALAAGEIRPGEFAQGNSPRGIRPGGDET